MKSLFQFLRLKFYKAVSVISKHMVRNLLIIE